VANLHDTWSNSVYPNPVLGLLLRQAAREGCNGTFGRCIVQQRRVAHVRRDGAAVDNRVAALHMLERILAHSEHGNDVCLECLFRDVEVYLRDVETHFLHCGCWSLHHVLVQ
jgi:hypothetical protein